MLRRAVLVAGLALLAGTGASGAGSPAAATAAKAASRRALLVPLAGTPFRVRGSRFGAGERVRVTVTPTGRAAIVRRVRASRRGAFVLAFARVRACRGVQGTATGSRGSLASFQFSSVRC
jgi:hypothetical protein